MPEPTAGIAAFLRAGTNPDPLAEVLVVPQWQAADWNTLLANARRLELKKGDVLIRKDASERALYLVASGMLEVTSLLSSHSMGLIAKVQPGSVVGEMAFLDGRPRSAKVWAVADSEVYQLDFENYERFADAHPRKACNLLFAIGRIVALRLRRSQT
jgi:CRP-like cAMP-binding protein